VALAKVIRHAGADPNAPRLRVFDTALDAVADVAAGRADVGAITAASPLPELEARRLTAIGISSAARLGGPFTDVPTWTEQGVDCVVGSWRGVSGAEGLDAAQCEFWEHALKAAVATSEWQAALGRNFWTPMVLTGAQITMRKLPQFVLAFVGLLLAAPLAAADEQRQVSRLPPLPQPLDPVLKEMFDRRGAMGGSVINLSLVRGHAPKLAKASEVLAFALRFDAVTPRNLRELAIFRTAEIVGSDYELNQHKPLMKMCGYSDDQIAQVATWQSSKLFDDKERALLGYVEQTAHGGNVDDPTFANLSKFFTPQEIVEITMTIGNYYSTGLFTKALKIEVETDGRLTVAGKC
jgi:alkylhydroperoxidase family enzyme